MALTDSAAAPRGNILAQWAKGLFNWLVAQGEGASRNKTVQHLNRLSDEQLAMRGLTRRDIVMHVYRDLY